MAAAACPQSHPELKESLTFIGCGLLESTSSSILFPVAKAPDKPINLFAHMIFDELVINKGYLDVDSLHP